MASIGSVVAIVVVKQFFGGIGQNFANPAITARIVLLLSFGAQMGNWATPFSWKTGVTTSATPLAVEYGSADAPTLIDMFLGNRGGSLGETCAFALILGGIYLIARKVISPAIPLTYIGTVALITLIAEKGNISAVLYQVMGGGLLLGAFFMATDYSTCPIKVRGKIIFGVGCGIITALIRIFGSMTEGVSFAILIMNLVVPYIDRLTIPKPFGTPKKEKKAKEAAEK
jgi:electron transport complex protein RnfD